MTDDELARLRAVAEGATRGPWRLSAATRFVRDPLMRDYQRTIRGAWPAGGTRRSDHDAPWVADVGNAQGNCWSDAGADAEHIAAFDPPTALRLLDEVERLRGLVDPRLAVAWDDEDASRYDAIPVIE